MPGERPTSGFSNRERGAAKEARRERHSSERGTAGENLQRVRLSEIGFLVLVGHSVLGRVFGSRFFFVLGWTLHFRSVLVFLSGFWFSVFFLSGFWFSVFWFLVGHSVLGRVFGSRFFFVSSVGHSIFGFFFLVARLDTPFSVIFFW